MLKSQNLLFVLLVELVVGGIEPRSSVRRFVDIDRSGSEDCQNKQGTSKMSIKVGWCVKNRLHNKSIVRDALSNKQKPLAKNKNVLNENSKEKD